jgi:hypothetical protein
MKSAAAIGVLHGWALPAPSADYVGAACLGFGVTGSCQMVRKSVMWTSAQSEVREIVWLASVVGALSILGTGLAVALAMVLVI